MIRNYKLLKILLSKKIDKGKIRRANLSDANLSDADLSRANLSRADLSRANLSRTDLSGANLSDVYLSRADLSGANLSGANLSRADLSGANLSDVIISESTFGLTINCPEIGAFVGFKKVRHESVIVVLEILENSKRSSATTYKCRASHVKVIRIENYDGTISDKIGVLSDFSNENPYSEQIYYEIGKEIIIHNFDENRWNECSTGIHFFINRQMALNY
jgi:uncharacterized protein YjbI with pentapeptide repeats